MSLRATALRMLARRDFGRVELAERLRARGATPDELAKLLDELERAGYLSDARFAQAVVDRKAGQFGKRAIAHELKERRISPAAASKALESLSGEDELAEARALWQRRFGVAPKSDRRSRGSFAFSMRAGIRPPWRGKSCARRARRKTQRADRDQRIATEVDVVSARSTGTRPRLYDGRCAARARTDLR